MNPISRQKGTIGLLLVAWLYCFILGQMADAWAQTGPQPSSNSPHWTYYGEEGMDHWGMLSHSYMTCETGSHQSPVDITMSSEHQAPARLQFHYRTADLQAMHNGHSIQVRVSSGNELHVNGRTYQLMQFHFHEPSEHHIEGKSSPFEIHLVHRDRAGHIVVVSLLAELGPGHPVVSTLWSSLPMYAGESAPSRQLELSTLIPNNLHHFAYHGSLTTPPCTEGVQWIVMKEKISIAQAQIDQFVALVGHNARAIQPIHDRRVLAE
jgi:carbonic anhydrase